MKINPFFFHKITAQLLIFLRLFDGMVHPAGSRKERFYTECWGVLKSTLPTFFSL